MSTGGQENKRKNFIITLAVILIALFLINFMPFLVPSWYVYNVYFQTPLSQLTNFKCQVRDADGGYEVYLRFRSDQPILFKGDGRGRTLNVDNIEGRVVSSISKHNLEKIKSVFPKDSNFLKDEHNIVCLLDGADSSLGFERLFIFHKPSGYYYLYSYEYNLMYGGFLGFRFAIK